MMTLRTSIFAVLVSTAASAAFAQQPEPAAPRRITLDEAVDLALAHNHLVRLAQLSVDEKEHAKNAERSGLFPRVRTDVTLVHLSDTQLIEIPAGGLGVVGSAPIPPKTLILQQGGLNAVGNGTGIVQPLTQLFKVRAATDVARAEENAARGKARSLEDDTVLGVHQVYYRILVAEVRRNAVLAKIQATEDLQRERAQQVRYGAELEADLIQSRAQGLQAKQDLLATELQLSDLQMQFNDLVGLPLTTSVVLDPNVPLSPQGYDRDASVRTALESHPDIAEARAQVDKAAAAVRLARNEFIPDLEAFARYSFQDNVPFLASHYGTVGIRATYDLFDGGKRRSVNREREAQLQQAKENLARISDEVELRVQTAYNKLERTRQMIAVSQELVTLRRESHRVTTVQLAQGAALRSQTAESNSQELDARAALLQAQLDYLLAADEMKAAIGRRP